MLLVTPICDVVRFVIVTFLDAIRQYKWIRRHGFTRVYCVSDVRTHLYSVCRADLLADDWEPAIDKPDPIPEEDASAKRFSLLELDKR